MKRMVNASSDAVLVMLCMLLAACAGRPAGDAADPAGLDPPLKLYVFDCGELAFADVAAFGLTNDETSVRTMFVPCYLIDHPDGTLFWDAGLPLSVVGNGWVDLQPGTRMRYRRSVVDQLSDAGHEVSEVDFVALSHMHFDHAGAANQFAASHLLIQASEYSAAFENADEYPVFDPSLYNRLEDASKTLLDGDHDVFGDGRVLIINAPGHTPGHQVLFLDLANTGPLLLSGDLYHFRTSRRLRRVPQFNSDAAVTLESMDKVERFLRQSGATLWIEHDEALAQTLRKAPGFYD
jgi:N-acyl homoserine lactone hydrolase